MIYPARKDWFPAALLPVLGVGLLGVAVAVPILLLAKAGPPNPPWTALPAALAFLVPGAMGVLLLWMYFSSSYEITPSELLVRLGPLRRRIALSAIEEVSPRTGFRLEAGQNYALSLDRLRVRYRRSSGRMAWLPMEISPQDKEGFLRELASCAPGLLPAPDGGLRRPEGASAAGARSG
jgi:hypothetical protein